MEDSLTMVDEHDNIIGPVSKFQGHYKDENGKIARPHRAFSLFLFNRENELLL